jgi:hypothetical protein
MGFPPSARPPCEGIHHHLVLTTSGGCHEPSKTTSSGQIAAKLWEGQPLRAGNQLDSGPNFLDFKPAFVIELHIRSQGQHGQHQRCDRQSC